jgi:hypothetical protein
MIIIPTAAYPGSPCRILVRAKCPIYQLFLLSMSAIGLPCFERFLRRQDSTFARCPIVRYQIFRPEAKVGKVGLVSVGVELGERERERERVL